MFIWPSRPTELPKDTLERLLRIEAKLDRILDHLGIQHKDLGEGPSLSSEVRELARDGRKIEAIKLHREQTGAGLKAAKDAVEAFLGQ